MGHAMLKERADRLEELLQKYSAESDDVSDCYQQLRPVLERARRPQFASLESLPCSRAYTEGLFDLFPGLARAYGDFYAAALDLDESGEDNETDDEDEEIWEDES